MNTESSIEKRRITVSDVTLREYCEGTRRISFREKVECAKLLALLGADVIETARITNPKTDTLFLHTIAPLAGKSVICCPADLTEASVEQTAAALSCAAHPRLLIAVPTSPVQMEFICHKKAKDVLKLIETLVARAYTLCSDVEFAAVDATRSDGDFLALALNAAISSGARTVTLCDSAGVMLPDEFASFIKGVKTAVPALENVCLSVECSDRLSMGAASVITSLGAGACQIKTGVSCAGVPSTLAVSDIFRAKSASMGCFCGLNDAVLGHAVEGIMSMLSGTRKSGSPLNEAPHKDDESFTLEKDDDIKTVAACVEKLGYDLSEEDITKVFESFKQLAEKKLIGARELDAIIASTALQVTPLYKLKSYVINSGNIISATAHIELEREGELLRGISLGDGPIDASFLAIEQIAGHHFELDDFQIQSVTEGRGAVGEAIVKLRSSGKLYSGRGVSTDIIGASIKAYINALNKICFEEN